MGITFRVAASLTVKMDEVLVILRSMVIWLPYKAGENASCPVFHRVTDARAWEHPVLMNASILAALPVSLAFTPKQLWTACRLALFPLPLLPQMKLT